jgi:hypothetical protein
MAAAHVQSTGTTTDGTTNTTVSKAFTSSVTAGNVLLCSVAFYKPTSTFTGTGVTGGGTWTEIAALRNYDATGQVHGAYYICASATGGATTVTFTMSVAEGYRQMFITEVSGATATTDGTSTMITAGFSATTTGNSLTPTTAGDFRWGTWRNTADFGAGSVTATSPWTLGDQQGDGSTTLAGATEWYVEPGTTARAASFGHAGNRQGAVGQVLLLAASGGGGATAWGGHLSNAWCRVVRAA